MHDHWIHNKEKLKPTRAVVGPIVERLVSFFAPDTLQRLNRASDLLDKSRIIERKFRAFGHTNFGATGDSILLAHFALAMEFEKVKYWWMRSIQPIKRLGN